MTPSEAALAGTDLASALKGFLLRQGPTGGQPARKAAPEASQKTSIGSGRTLVCAACGHRITSERERISVLDSHEHRFFNPAGFLFHIGCFRSAPGCCVVGHPTTEFTWFPGFAWCHAMCDRCGQHLGWRFSDSEANSFFGLVLNRLAEAEER
jgi:hypothetical protein